MHMLPPFCIKTNLRENRLFAAEWAVGEKKLVIMLKNALKIRQVLVGELTSSYPCFDTNSAHI